MKRKIEEYDFRLKVFLKAALCRNFENEVYENITNANIKFPTYLSAGQECIPSALYTVLEEKGIDVNTFIQHRGHSHYLAKGADPVKLIDELLGRKTGCANGMGGSASIHSIEKNIFGHDGLMGSQVPIAVGHCYETKKPTVVVMGDASAEEDYVLGAMGWASTKNLPILFLVEDNNLSILTEKKVRRNWDSIEVARGFRMKAIEIFDHPMDIYNALRNYDFTHPLLLNVNTIRKYWHSGAGKDGDYFDRFDSEKQFLGIEGEYFNNKAKWKVKKLWEKQLEKQ